MSKRKHRTKLKPLKKGKLYRQLWRLVDGAVRDCFDKHPDYLTGKGHARARARNSVNKRVVGSILGYTEQVARVQGRSEGVQSPSGGRKEGAAIPGSLPGA